ncbi:ABC transporter substrate-binding protein [Cohnella nanjingensis]|uniref:Extracellular solute-binding protein n=1 Tax=Cohnella nanjingensis TaxID=1387779 RepID=A0A7X0VEZ3_9BACL|nr:extracellular solute-binding protein [Cohnella nanjingensis]MBB6670089.1 extracellular solute-binding protein [Cohnella nanjingensis]
MKKISMFVVSCLLIVVFTGCTSASGEGGTDNQITNSHTEQPGASTQATQPAAMPSPDPNKQSTLVFSMYKRDSYFETAAKAYEKEHPNTKINVKYIVKNTSEDISRAKQEKFKSTMIADFLNGKGPDLVVMDALPADKYVAKGLLANVGDMLKGDPSFKKENYYMNILDSLQTSEGGLYMLPLSFSLHTLTGDQQLLEQSGVHFNDQSWTWTEFLDTIQQLTAKRDDRYGFMAFDENNLLLNMARTDYNRLVDAVNRTAHFDSDLFLGMLEQIKQMKGQTVLYYGKELKQTEGSKGFPIYFGEDELLTPYQYFQYAANMQNSKEHSLVFYEKPKAEGQQPGGYFEPYLKIAIHAKSSLQPEAWDFLKFLMSGQASAAAAWGANDLTYEGQGFNGTFPISKSLYTAKTDNMVQAGPLQMLEGGPVKITEQDLKKLDSLVTSANKPIFDGEILQIMAKESPAYFHGQKSAQEVAKIIQNKVTTYLNE